MPTNYWLGGDTGNETDYNTPANWSLGAVPVAADDVVIQGTFGITGFDASAVALGSFTISPGYSATIGSLSQPLQVQVDPLGTVDMHTTGLAYLTVTGAPSVVSRRTQGGSTGGTRLINSTLGAVTALQGQLSLIASTASRVLSANTGTVNVDSDSVVTDVDATSGTINSEANVTNYNCSGLGTINVAGGFAVAEIDCAGGIVNSNGAGVVTLAKATGGGLIDSTGSSVPGRTYTTVQVQNGRFLHDPDNVSVGSFTGSGTLAVSTV